VTTERPDDLELAPERFTPAQRTGLDIRRADQDRTLDAIHKLESALSAAATRREDDWRRDVLGALEVLERATGEEERNAALPESLVSDVARPQPRLRNRVRGLRVQYRRLQDSVAAVHHELQDPDALIDVADVRQRLAWLLAAFQHQRARESDLIYEAYYEAFHRDLLDDARGLP
jgi:hypothetical protein